MHSNTTSKSCEQNAVAALNDIDNVRHNVKKKWMYSVSFEKPGKQHAVINHEKLVKEESVKDIDSKVSGISTILSKVQNKIKRITI